MYQYTYTGNTTGDLDGIGPVSPGQVITPAGDFALEAKLIQSRQFSRQLITQAPQADSAVADATASETKPRRRK